MNYYHRDEAGIYYDRTNDFMVFAGGVVGWALRQLFYLLVGLGVLLIRLCRLWGERRRHKVAGSKARAGRVIISAFLSILLLPMLLPSPTREGAYGGAEGATKVRPTAVRKVRRVGVVAKYGGDKRESISGMSKR